MVGVDGYGNGGTANIDADLDPRLAPDADADHDGGAADPAPICGRCGGDLGIFLRFGLDWRHYTGTGLHDIEMYEPGHPAELTWRSPAAA